MSTGLPVFDTTIGETNEWLKLVEARLRPCDRQQAYGGLRAVLHVLRDRLPIEAVMGLSAQLPMLLRGVCLEGWRPLDGPSDIRDPEMFAQEIARRLPPSFPRQADDTAKVVFGVLAERLDGHEVRKLIQYLPTSLRGYWPAAQQPA